VLAVASLAETLARKPLHVHGQYLLVLCLLALATTLPVALPYPSVAAVTVTVASCLSLAPFHSLTVAGASTQLLVLHRLGRDGTQLVAAALSLPFVVLALGLEKSTASGVLAILLAALAPCAAWTGTARKARTAEVAYSLVQGNLSGSRLEHLVRGERARIARELHDVVAHHISMIAVQAESARLTTTGMPAVGAQRLLAIGDTARRALTEMRRLLGVLREDVPDDVPALAPQPGLRQLTALIDASRQAAGTGTRLVLHGPPAALDPGVELAAYRIVQEALTNTRRHAPGAAVDVDLYYSDDALRLRVRDNGPGPSAAVSEGHAAGHGLLGMRERALAVGGQLRTGPASGGGFLVDALLPAKGETA
jgi:signal transduction histidine kinase